MPLSPNNLCFLQPPAPQSVGSSVPTVDRDTEGERLLLLGIVVAVPSWRPEKAKDVIGSVKERVH
jgi:hypothetical protein